MTKKLLTIHPQNVSEGKKSEMTNNRNYLYLATSQDNTYVYLDQVLSCFQFQHKLQDKFSLSFMYFFTGILMPLCVMQDFPASAYFEIYTRHLVF